MDQLPSAGTDPASLGDLSADASRVRQILDAVNEPVVLVGHSYGGMVTTELADHPKVQHTVYLTALWPERGQSALNLFGDVLPPTVIRRDDGATQITDDFMLVAGDVSRLGSPGSNPVPVVIPVRSHLLAGLYARRLARHLRGAFMLLAILTCVNAAHHPLPCEKLSGENSPALPLPEAVRPDSIQ